jgi:hypothetical protein
MDWYILQKDRHHHALVLSRGRRKKAKKIPQQQFQSCIAHMIYKMPETENDTLNISLEAFDKIKSGMQDGKCIYRDGFFSLDLYMITAIKDCSKALSLLATKIFTHPNQCPVTIEFTADSTAEFNFIIRCVKQLLTMASLEKKGLGYFEYGFNRIDPDQRIEARMKSFCKIKQFAH